MLNAEPNEEQITEDLPSADDGAEMITYFTESNSPYDWCIKMWD